MLIVWATANPGIAPETLEAALWAELKAVREGVDEADLERVKVGVEARQVMGLQQVGERADQISMFTTLFDDPERINTELDAYRRVTSSEVSDFAREFLRPDRAVVMTYVPRAAEEAA
jgi:predicted Zn-dependent peptidase